MQMSTGMAERYQISDIRYGEEREEKRRAEQGNKRTREQGAIEILRAKGALRMTRKLRTENRNSRVKN